VKKVAAVHARSDSSVDLIIPHLQQGAVSTRIIMEGQYKTASHSLSPNTSYDCTSSSDRVIFEEGNDGDGTTRGLVGYGLASRADDDFQSANGAGQNDSEDRHTRFIKRISATLGGAGRGAMVDLAKYNIDIEADEAENPFEEAAMEARMQYERHESRSRCLKQGILCASFALVALFASAAIGVSVKGNNAAQAKGREDAEAAKPEIAFEDDVPIAGDTMASNAFVPSPPPADLDTWCNASDMNRPLCYAACVEAQCCLNKKLPALGSSYSLTSVDGANQVPSSCFVHEYKDTCESYASCVNLFVFENSPF
jgi:hypothetical protein